MPEETQNEQENIDDGIASTAGNEHLASKKRAREPQRSAVNPESVADEVARRQQTAQLLEIAGKYQQLLVDDWGAVILKPSDEILLIPFNVSKKDIGAMVLNSNGIKKLKDILSQK